MLQPVQYAHWHQFFDGISVSTRAAYEALENDVKTSKIPDTSVSRVEFREGGPLSAARTYLKIQRDWLAYHICVAPFGSGFFVSSRLLVWPFSSWPTIAVVTGVAVFLVFIFFLAMTATSNSAVLGFLAAGVCLIPTLLILAAVVVIWFIICRRLTWYRLDSMLAFHEAVHGLLVARVNSLIEAGGLKPLTEAQSKPILHKLLER